MQSPKPGGPANNRCGNAYPLASPAREYLRSSTLLAAVTAVGLGDREQLKVSARVPGHSPAK